MTVVAPTKFLPQGKKGGPLSLGRFFVLSKTVQSQKIKSSVPKERKITLYTIKNQVVRVEKLVKTSAKIQKKAVIKSRKKEETTKRSLREKLLESSGIKKKVKSFVPVKVPGQGILDSVFNFLGMVLLGTLAVRFKEILPSLLQVGRILTPLAEVLKFIGSVVINTFSTFVDRGYRAIDFVQGIVKNIGGEDAVEAFNKFSQAFNTFINLAIIAGLSTMGGTDFSGRRRGPLGFLRNPKTGFDHFGRRVGSRAMQRYLQIHGKQAFLERFGKKNLKFITQKVAAETAETIGKETVKRTVVQGGTRVATQGTSKVVAQKTTTSIAKNFFRTVLKPRLGGVPVLGGLLEFGLSWALGDSADKAAFRGIGSTLVGVIGGLIGSLGGPGLGTGIGYFLGGMAGAEIGGVLYDMIFGNKKPSIPAKGSSSGGRIKGKKRTEKVSKKIRMIQLPPQATKPGENVGGVKEIKQLFPSPESMVSPSALRSLMSTSELMKRIYMFGNIMGAAVDMALGQRPSLSAFESVDPMMSKIEQDKFRSSVEHYGSLIRQKILDELSKSKKSKAGEYTEKYDDVVPPEEKVERKKNLIRTVKVDKEGKKSSLGWGTKGLPPGRVPGSKGMPGTQGGVINPNIHKATSWKKDTKDTKDTKDLPSRPSSIVPGSKGMPGIKGGVINPNIHKATWKKDAKVSQVNSNGNLNVDTGDKETNNIMLYQVVYKEVLPGTPLPS